MGRGEVILLLCELCEGCLRKSGGGEGCWYFKNSYVRHNVHKIHMFMIYTMSYTVYKGIVIYREML